MRYIVGLSPDQGGREALALGSLLARSSEGSLTVVTVVPETWGPPSLARVDAEYAQFVLQNAQKSLAKAKASISSDVDADFIAVPAKSARDGLLRAAQDMGADCIVVGSSRSAPPGRFAEGSVATGLLHSADLPIAIAPRGYLPDPRSVVRRISCAFSPSPASAVVVRKSAELCGIFEVPLRLVTLIARDKQMYPTGAGYDAENMVANTMREQAQVTLDEMTADWDGAIQLTSEIGDGKTWKSAFDSLLWASAEILVIGSSSLGPIARVFLGSKSGKIAQNSPVPCLIMPRHGS